MNVAELIDSVIDNGGDGQAVVSELIKYGHLPPDANDRPAGKTAQEVRTVEELRTKMQTWLDA